MAEDLREQVWLLEAQATGVGTPGLSGGKKHTTEIPRTILLISRLTWDP